MLVSKPFFRVHVHFNIHLLLLYCKCLIKLYQNCLLFLASLPDPTCPKLSSIQKKKINTATKGAVRCVFITPAQTFQLNPQETHISHFIVYVSRIVFLWSCQPSIPVYFETTRSCSFFFLLLHTVACLTEI